MQGRIQVRYDDTQNRFSKLVEKWLDSKKSFEETKAATELLAELDIDSLGNRNSKRFEYYANYAGAAVSCQFFERLSRSFNAKNESEKQNLNAETKFLNELRKFDNSNCLSLELASFKYTNSTDPSNRTSIVNIHKVIQEAQKNMGKKYSAKKAIKEQEDISAKKELLTERTPVKSTIDAKSGTLTKEIPSTSIDSKSKTAGVSSGGYTSLLGKHAPDSVSRYEQQNKPQSTPTSISESTQKAALLIEIKRIKNKLDSAVGTLTKEIPNALFSSKLKTAKRDKLQELSSVFDVSETSSLDDIKKAVSAYKTKLYKSESDTILRQGSISTRSKTLVDDLSKDLEKENHSFNRLQK